VHAALGIPDWADAFDLHATDDCFDGDAFHAYTDGDLARALPQLVAEIERGENEIFPAESDRAAAARQRRGACGRRGRAQRLHHAALRRRASPSRPDVTPPPCARSD